MRASAFLLVLTLAAAAVAAPVPVPGPREVERLVEKLGSDEFAEREAATRRLEELGALALDALRAASKSESPEVADRARDLVRKIERRISSDRLLTPTLVELDLKDTPLDDVLAALSRQAGCEVVIGGLKPHDAAAKKVTVATGKVPFWGAVLKVCDAGQLQVAGAGGFLAPGAMPYILQGKGSPKLRVATDPDRAVILEAREGKMRPASVHSAVLVEALEVPRAAAQAGAVLQFWPEPRLAWQSVSSVKLEKAVDGEGRTLTPDFAPPRLSRPGTPAVPNLRQAVIPFKPGDGPTRLARELSGSAFGLVRSAPEPVAVVQLDSDKAVAVAGQAGAEVKASTRTDANGRKFVDVTIAFSPAAVDPVRASDELPDVKPSATGGNRSILGVRVTDATGAAFELALANQRSDFERTSRRIVTQLSLGLVVARDGPATPAKVAFWGTTMKPVEIPFTLKDVPLGGR